jgi:hypothetical protein
MATLHELDVSSIAASQNEAFIREMISKLFWTWYYANMERKITTIRVWFIRKTLYVKDLFAVFELLFGPSPAQ